MIKTIEMTVRGMVQGIGFRPFVARLAEQLNMKGSVQNSDGIVKIVVKAEESDIDLFEKRLHTDAPDGARIDSISLNEISDVSKKAGVKDAGFFIVPSDDKKGEQAPMIPVDLPTCARCEKELFDPSNRRFRYPFISCVACGPRYSIMRKLPYDRENITMNQFPMCPACKAEYQEKDHIRRHAQTIGCRDCGPVLKLGDLYEDAAYDEAVEILKSGGIVAIKDIGGFHLACLPQKKETVKVLRLIKGREKKPFAVMFPDVNEIRNWAVVSEQEEHLLLSSARPIVLLTKLKDMGDVVGKSPYIGAMLPCNPLQIMLMRDVGPLIMTSANSSSEPIITDNEIMEDWVENAQGKLQELKEAGDKEKAACENENKAENEISLGVLSHNREILTPLDDSIVRSVRGNRTQIIRRARGYVPEPVELRTNEEREKAENSTCQKKECEIFAAGGDLKSTFAYKSGNRVYLGQYLGDLADVSVMENYRKQAIHMKELFHFHPKVFVGDLHPGYYSSREIASEKNGKRLFVQHHHAHAASVIGEHGLVGTTLAVVLDGTGYGTDGTIWGSEFLLCQGKNYERVGHLKNVTLIGGDEGARNADSSMYGYINTTSFNLDDMKIPWVDARKAKLISKAVSLGVNTVTSTSMGRLFDGVSALLNICHINEYEGEAPIELEYEAMKAEKFYELRIPVELSGTCAEGRTDIFFHDLIKGVESGVDTRELALGFHMAVAGWILEMVGQIEGAGHTFSQVALSGGCFQNSILLDKTIELLEANGYDVYINESVPAGDSGICLGQAYLAGLE